MGRRKIARDPLLYIHQPKVRTPKAPMQDHYRTPKKQKESEIPPEKKPQQTQRTIKRKSHGKSGEYPFKNEQPFPSKADEWDDTYTKKPADNLSSQELEEESQSADRIKFKDMTIEEKVNYFINQPRHVPKLKCEVETNERKYRGIITDFQEDQVFIRVGRRTSNTEIPLNEIINIRMLGF